MDQTTTTKIENTIRRLENLRETKQKFLEHLNSHTKAERIQAELSVSADVISIPCFGYIASAKPRPVSAGDGFFVFEYVFLAEDADEKEIELWRFYLARDGRLRTGLDENTFLCDMDNTLISDYLCTHVFQAALDSQLLAPRRKSDG